MSRGVILIVLATTAILTILTTLCVFLTVQNGQLQEDLSEMMSMMYKMQGQLDREHEERQKLARQNDLLDKMILRNKEVARGDVQNVLSLQIGLISNVVAMKGEHESTMARIDEKMDENQKTFNNSMRDLIEMFVNEIMECKNKTSLISEKVKQLEAREPVMIENKIHVETEYHQVVEFREPQLTWGEWIGQRVGGAVESGAVFLLSKALGIVGLL